MKKVNRISGLRAKELQNKKEFRGGNPPVDRPKRPSGGMKPPFGKKRS